MMAKNRKPWASGRTESHSLPMARRKPKLKGAWTSQGRSREQAADTIYVAPTENPVQILLSTPSTRAQRGDRLVR